MQYEDLLKNRQYIQFIDKLKYKVSLGIKEEIRTKIRKFNIVVYHSSHDEYCIYIEKHKPILRERVDEYLALLSH